MSKNIKFKLGQVPRNFLWGFSLISLLFLFFLSPPVFHRLFCDFQVQQEEAVILEMGRVVLAGEPLYRDIRLGGPYLHPYPFLYPVLLSHFMRFIPGLWLPGRLPTFLGYLACGFLLLGWGWRRWGPPLSLALAALFWLSPTWRVWGSMARMDTLLVLVNFIGFVLVYSHLVKEKNKTKNSDWWLWIGAGFLNSLALMMKPSACTLTLAVLAYLLWNREWKKGAVFLAAVLIPYVLTASYWQWKSQGGYGLFLWLQAGSFKIGTFWYFLTRPFARECGWLVFSLLVVFWKRSWPLFLRFQLFFTLLWFLLAAFQENVAENHFMEFILVGLFALGEGLVMEGQKLSRTRGVGVMALLCLGLFLNVTAPTPRVPSTEEINAKTQVLGLYEKGEKHFAIDTDLPYMVGKRIWYQHSGLMPFYKNGFLDPAPLIRDVKEMKFATVELYDIPRQFLVPEVVVEEIKKNYHVGVRNNGRLWLFPNTEQSNSR